MHGYYVDSANSGWGFHIGDHTGSQDYGMLYYFTRMGAPVWCTLTRDGENLFKVNNVKGAGLPGTTTVTSVEECGTLELLPVPGQLERYKATLTLNANSPLAVSVEPSPKTPYPYVRKFVAQWMVITDQLESPDPSSEDKG